LTTANWLALIVLLSGGLVIAGGLLVRVKIAESAIKDFARAREKQGERIGGVEERIAILEGASHLESAVRKTRKRTRPGGVPMPVAPDESSEA
jgi:hypothetical protein